MIQFVPHGEFARVLKQARLDLESYQAFRADPAQPKFEDLIETELPKSIRSQETIAPLFHSKNAKLRMAAASLSGTYWPAHEHFAKEALRLAFGDDNPAVRGAALTALNFHTGHIQDPTGFLESLLRTLFTSRRTVLAHAQNLVGRVQNDMRQVWEGLAGTHLQDMLKSRESTGNYLRHADPNLRTAAIFILNDHWKPNEEFLTICERMIFQDPDLKVRCLALSTLSCWSGETNDSHLGRLAASLAYDKSIPKDLRLTAYRALFTIRGRGTDDFIAVHSPTFSFPEDVDWSFVDSFLN